VFETVNSEGQLVIEGRMAMGLSTLVLKQSAYNFYHTISAVSHFITQRAS